MVDCIKNKGLKIVLSLVLLVIDSLWGRGLEMLSALVFFIYKIKIKYGTLTSKDTWKMNEVVSLEILCGYWRNRVISSLQIVQE